MARTLIIAQAKQMHTDRPAAPYQHLRPALGSAELVPLWLMDLLSCRNVTGADVEAAPNAAGR